jgi:hypothetical protein
MTAKEKLRRAVEGLSEAEAAEALEILVRRQEGGEAGERTAPTLDELLDNAPLDDEPETEEERRAVAEGEEDLRRGNMVSLDEIRSELT